MIRKLKTGEYRIYSLKKNPKTGKRRNLGTFTTREAAEKHEKRNSILQKAMTHTIRSNDGLKWMITFIECQQFSGSDNIFSVIK